MRHFQILTSASRSFRVGDEIVHARLIAERDGDSLTHLRLRTVGEPSPREWEAPREQVAILATLVDLDADDLDQAWSEPGVEPLILAIPWRMARVIPARGAAWAIGE